MSGLIEFVRWLRPAPLGFAAAKALGLSRRRVVHTPQGKFLVSPVSHLGYQLASGEYEPGMTAVLRNHLKPGAVFIDLGANEGYFSVIGSTLVGCRGTVIAVEPQSRLMSVIHANLALNGCLNVRVVQGVVSSKTETVDLHLAPELSTGGSALSRHTKYRLPVEKVQSFTLGDFLGRAGVASCDLMKVDIEGAEYDVFMNSAEILKTGLIRKIALEIHDSLLASRGLSGSALHELITECGYEEIDRSGNRLYAFAGPSKNPPVG